MLHFHVRRDCNACSKILFNSFFFFSNVLQLLFFRLKGLTKSLLVNARCIQRLLNTMPTLEFMTPVSSFCAFLNDVTTELYKIAVKLVSPARNASKGTLGGVAMTSPSHPAFSMHLEGTESKAH